MYVTVDMKYKKVPGLDRRRRTVKAYLNRDEYDTLRIKAHKNAMQTAEFVHHLFEYAMNEDDWIPEIGEKQMEG